MCVCLCVRVCGREVVRVKKATEALTLLSSLARWLNRSSTGVKLRRGSCSSKKREPARFKKERNNK